MASEADVWTETGCFIESMRALRRRPGRPGAQHACERCKRSDDLDEQADKYARKTLMYASQLLWVKETTLVFYCRVVRYTNDVLNTKPAKYVV